MAYKTPNEKNQRYSRGMISIDAVMLSSLKGEALSDYMIFRSAIGNDMNAKKITPKQAYDKVVLYSNENLKLREDNVRRGIDSLVSDEQEYTRAGFRIAPLSELATAID